MGSILSGVSGVTRSIEILTCAINLQTPDTPDNADSSAIVAPDSTPDTDA